MPDPAKYSGADEEWEDLLRQWRAQSAAQPRPFFYNRVYARLVDATSEKPAWLPTWLRWPAYLAMSGMLVLALSGDGASLPSAGRTTPYESPTDGPQPALPTR
ncbi:hypothetical protein [Hymenobacter sp. CRA2]|uniref:hypothetical protein n=1 Tax=Hymenobacter sp. CRA2 TaxID=1955620 RepID=UPI00098F0ACD|nr:hypothetical protein [Hymenobacter sp. CRA2]OON67371.1 hypothetical protein B0919_18055 [Hymenobacter sp. CRA2]